MAAKTGSEYSSIDVRWPGRGKETHHKRVATHSVKRQVSAVAVAGNEIVSQSLTLITCRRHFTSYTSARWKQISKITILNLNILFKVRKFNLCLTSLINTHTAKSQSGKINCKAFNFYSFQTKNHHLSPSAYILHDGCKHYSTLYTRSIIYATYSSWRHFLQPTTT